LWGRSIVLGDFYATEGSSRTSGWVQSALPMGEVRALPGVAGRGHLSTAGLSPKSLVPPFGPMAAFSFDMSTLADIPPYDSRGLA